MKVFAGVGALFSSEEQRCGEDDDFRTRDDEFQQADYLVREELSFRKRSMEMSNSPDYKQWMLTHTRSSRSTKGEHVRSATCDRVRTRDIICYVCTGRGHYEHDCPNLKLMHAQHVVKVKMEEETTCDHIVVIPSVPPIIEEKVVENDVVVSKEEEVVEKENEINIIPEEMEEVKVDIATDFSLQVPDCSDAIIEEDSPITLVGGIAHEEDRPNTNSAELIEQFTEIHATYIYFDLFLLHCNPLDFVIADLYAVKIKMYKRMITALFTSLVFLDVSHCVGLLMFVWPRLLFDPGRFEVESFRMGDDMMWPGRP